MYSINNINEPKKIYPHISVRLVLSQNLVSEGPVLCLRKIYLKKKQNVQ